MYKSATTLLTLVFVLLSGATYASAKHEGSDIHLRPDIAFGKCISRFEGTTPRVLINQANRISGLPETGTGETDFSNLQKAAFFFHLAFGNLTPEDLITASKTTKRAAELAMEEQTKDELYKYALKFFDRYMQKIPNIDATKEYLKQAAAIGNENAARLCTLKAVAYAEMASDMMLPTTLDRARFFIPHYAALSNLIAGNMDDIGTLFHRSNSVFKGIGERIEYKVTERDVVGCDQLLRAFDGDLATFNIYTQRAPFVGQLANCAIYTQVVLLFLSDEAPGKLARFTPVLSTLHAVLLEDKELKEETPDSIEVFLGIFERAETVRIEEDKKITLEGEKETRETYFEYKKMNLRILPPPGQTNTSVFRALVGADQTLYNAIAELI